MKGMSAPHWQDLENWKTWTPPPGTELISKEDFIKSSKKLVGSRDLGAFLFHRDMLAAGLCVYVYIYYFFGLAQNKKSLAVFSNSGLLEEKYSSTNAFFSLNLIKRCEWCGLFFLFFFSAGVPSYSARVPTQPYITLYIIIVRLPYCLL